MVKFKSDGYMVFFRTIEVMGREFDVTNPGVNTFSIAFFRKKFTISWQKTVKILQFFDKKGRIKVLFGKEDGLETITLNCPKLLELCDEYTQRALTKLSGQTPDTIGTNSVTEEERDSSGVPSPSSSPTPPSKSKSPRGTSTRSSGDEQAGFDQFWSSYPRKVGKTAALKAWKRLKPNLELLQIILGAVDAQARSLGWTKDGGQFIPYPATWLNGRRWDDEITVNPLDGKVSEVTKRTIRNLENWRPPDD